MDCSQFADVFTFEDTDQLFAAENDVTNDSRLSPHIQGELRQTIISRRQARGEGDIEVEDQKPIKYELTAEEQRRRERRKEQNRRAARKHREKKKQGQANSAKIEKLAAENSKLQKDIVTLNTELEQLQSIFAIHQQPGHCVHSQVDQHCVTVPSPSPSIDHTQAMTGQTSDQGELPVEEVTYSNLDEFVAFQPMTNTYDDQVNSYDNTQYESPMNSTYQASPFVTTYGQHHSLTSQYGNTGGFAGDIELAGEDKPISGNDTWLQTTDELPEMQRRTPDIALDDSLYTTQDVKPVAPEPVHNEVIGVPSLDSLQMEKLLFYSANMLNG